MEAFVELELDKIIPNTLNPRTDYDEKALIGLATSIKRVGVLEPVIVRSHNGKYEVVVGERRFRAAKIAGLSKIPVIIKDYSDEFVIELSLIENVQRVDLNAVEKAKACKQLKEKYPQKYPTWENVAEEIGVAAGTVKDWMRTLALPEEIQQQIAPRIVQREKVPEGKIDYQTAIRITQQVKEPEKQIEIAKEFANKRISWRDARAVLKEVVREPNKPIKQVMHEVIEDAPIYLPFSKIHADAILIGAKTQTSRKGKEPKLQKGVIVRGQVTHFADLLITDIVKKKLADFNEDDAKREGGYTLEEFKAVWKTLHGKWNPDEQVFVISFKLLNSLGETASFIKRDDRL
jgi:ParB family chromosome partitioning protein